MAGAEEEEQAIDQSDAQASKVSCATCADNPCAHLACGVPGSRYRGGAHGCVGLAETKSGPSGSIHSHHMPAAAYSSLPRVAGPAIQMDRIDHFATVSYGGRVHGPSYAPQRAALALGQTMAAIMMDVADAKAVAVAQGEPGKYDGAIAQMLAYATCLRQHGFIG